MSWENVIHWIIGVSALLTSCTAAVPFIDGRWNRWSRFIRRHHKAILTVCGISVALLQGLLAFAMERVADIEKSETERRLFRYQDSLSHKYATNLDEKTKRIIETHTRALAEFGLKTESLNGEVIKVVEENKASPLSPDLKFCLEDGLKVDSIKGNVYYFSLNVCNRSAKAYDVNLSYYFVYQGDGLIVPLIFRDGDYDLIKGEEFSVDQQGTFTNTITLKYKCEILHCLLKGSYKDERGKVYTVHDFMSYEFATESTSKPIKMNSEKVIDKFKEVGFY